MSLLFSRQQQNQVRTLQDEIARLQRQLLNETLAKKASRKISVEAANERDDAVEKVKKLSARVLSLEQENAQLRKGVQRKHDNRLLPDSRSLLHDSDLPKMPQQRSS